MIPEGGKGLGINKSTLWYLKKNLNDSKLIKLKDKTLKKLPRLQFEDKQEVKM